MGHLAHSKQSLVPLIDRLNKNPIGLVDNETLREILSLLFDEKEAYVASKFPLTEATIEELSLCTKIPEKELKPILDRMADKGLLMDFPVGDRTYYLLLPGFIGFFEFTFMKKRTDLPMEHLAKLMTEYLHDDMGQAKEFFGSKTQLTRALVYEDKIPVTSTITTYEDAKKIIMKAGYGAVAMCYCRHKKLHQNEKCKKEAPLDDICISLGNAAKFMVRRGFSKELSTTELIKVLDRAREYKLTHVTDNIRNRQSFICNCCSCCCELMAGIKVGFKDGIAKTPFIATVDAEKCTFCGKCMKDCNIKGISYAKVGAKRVAKIDNDACLGCGACVDSCEFGAIKLVERERRHLPPQTRKELFKTMLKEKGRLTPFVVDGIKRKIRKFFK
ncbi:MAG: 4Fe-4S dicluster domain-containing protein [bacterium]